MRFAIAGIAAILWSLATVCWSLSRKQSPWQRRVILISIVVLFAVAASVATDARAIVSRMRARDSGVVIEIDDARQSWWRVRYGRGGARFITANEIHVPAGEIVTIDWRGQPAGSSASDFLVLNGRSLFVARKIGVDDTRVVSLWPPSLRHLTIVADSPTGFDRWFEHQTRAADARSPLFISAGCSFCHVVRGVAEDPDPEAPPAPDLTHFGSRLTIAATTMPNRPGFLSGWIVDSQSLKPKSLMPHNRLDPRVLQQLTAYLESLR